MNRLILKTLGLFFISGLFSLNFFGQEGSERVHCLDAYTGEVI